jgi:peptidoglycan/LPS O-acetylase OafA/YrhL
MISALRIALAILVMHVHFVSQSRQWGGNAVFLFYLLSGYFAVVTLQKGTHPWQFWVGRLWRILPTYWVILVATTAWVSLGEVGQYFYATVGYPSPLEVVGLSLSPRAVPVAWVLPVFWFWWGVLALGAASTMRRTMWFLMVGVALWLWLGVVPGGNNWGHLGAGAMPFAIGAALYWMGLKVPPEPRWMRQVGDLAFPVFLIHYPVGAAISTALEMPPGWPLFFAALGPTLALSWLLVVAVERPVAQYRKQLRQTHGD